MAVRRRAARQQAPRSKPKRKVARRAQPAVSPQFQELIGRALTDEEFRTLLFRNRARAIRGARLTATDRRALDQIKKSELDEQARALGSRAAWTVKVSVTVRF